MYAVKVIEPDGDSYDLGFYATEEAAAAKAAEVRELTDNDAEVTRA